MTENSENVNIKTVADHVGVSFKTVSRVINNGKSVRTQTRQRVEQAIKDLNYIPNVNARSMRTNRSQIIGFITDHIAITPFAVDIVNGAEQTAWEYERMLFVIDTQGIPERLDQSITMLKKRKVEGIIYAAMYHQEVDVPESMRKIPTVLVNCFDKDRSLPSVVPDEFSAGEQATEILIRNGHRKIALINLPEECAAAKGRLAGYQNALKKNGIQLFPELVISGLVRTDECEENRSYDVAMNILSMKDRPTAIFCGNDRIAMQVYNAAKDLQLSIPDDVAIMGFDNQEIIAKNLKPRLSTMELPHNEMGVWAINYLYNNYESNENIQKEIKCKYIERSSI